MTGNGLTPIHFLSTPHTWTGTSRYRAAWTWRQIHKNHVVKPAMTDAWKGGVVWERQGISNAQGLEIGKPGDTPAI